MHFSSSFVLLSHRNLYTYSVSSVITSKNRETPSDKTSFFNLTYRNIFKNKASNIKSTLTTTNYKVPRKYKGDIRHKTEQEEEQDTTTQRNEKRNQKIIKKRVLVSKRCLLKQFVFEQADVFLKQLERRCFWKGCEKHSKQRSTLKMLSLDLQTRVEL